MSKTALKTVEETETKSTALTTLGGGAIADFLSGDIEEFVGAGISERSKDFIVPLWYIAQSNSPQLKKQHAAYIPGLEPGDWFNTATRKFYKGEAGALVVPAYYSANEVEWVMRDEGGGYVATHPADSDITKTVRKGGPKDRFRILPNGHSLVETNYHFLVPVDDASPIVLGLSSSNLQVSRQFSTLMKARRFNRNGAPVVAPCFAGVYRLRTVFRSNDQGDWFSWAIEDAGWVTAEHQAAYAVAKEFYLHAKEHGITMGRPPETPVDDATSTVEGSALPQDDDVPF